MDFSFLSDPAAWTALGKVVLIDIALAGDNAIVVGALAAGLPPEQRRKVILIGVIAALVLRVAFALVVTQLLGIVGLQLAGGLLLLWVAWKMYREVATGATHAHAEDGVSVLAGGVAEGGPKPAKSFWSAAWAVAIADVSMSLDNVLAVAGAARDHPEVMVFGLILSIALMGLAANVIARYIEKYRWIAWVGVAVIVYVAIDMIISGGGEVVPLLG
ncbi:YjbE family putative metal transport protein [Sandaracinobacteroides saxicola]|uniref:YjbE family putative metal transport protein n=1 Tax=Sandaracinobacteroides saxicola TaxID=2759707 RepID=A0A7G5IFQ6_9SPHN|nr:YjbE family putative metal transport protein [Sandaracinobacteroides saxicola]QMW22198.1 YjbE family putative metal transport protein [Sandaracinobacteroides saxicola]